MAKKKLEPKKEATAPASQKHEDLQILHIDVGLLDAHPENREIKNPECESLADSIRMRGILDPLTVRPSPISPGRYQIIGGHRRTVAARMAGLDTVPAMVRDMGDREALEMVLVSNLERKDLDPAEVSRGVSALVAAGLTVNVLVERIHRSREWVQQYLALGELPAKMREAVAEKKVSMAVVAEVLRVDDADRERAIQLVLQPTMQKDPLNAEQSRAVLEREILGPQKLRDGWQKGMAKRLAAWKKRLAAAAKAAGAPASLVTLEVDAKLPGGNMQYALHAYEEDRLLEGAPEGATLAHLAIRHGLPIYVYPAHRARWLAPENGVDWKIAGEDPESIILVDEHAIETAEEALRDAGEGAGMVPWLGSEAPKMSDKNSYAAQQEKKNEVISAIDAELVEFTKQVLGVCKAADLGNRLWTAVFKNYLEGELSLDMAACIAGVVVPGYDEEEEADEFCKALHALTGEYDWPEGWPMLAGAMADMLGVKSYNLACDDVVYAGPETVARIRAALVLLDQPNAQDALPALHDLLAASERKYAEAKPDV